MKIINISIEEERIAQYFDFILKKEIDRLNKQPPLKYVRRLTSPCFSNYPAR